MQPVEILSLATDGFNAKLEKVTESDWRSSTPCEGWSVGDLVSHVITGSQMAVALAAGATPEELGGTPPLSLAYGDLAAACRSALAEQLDVLSNPELLDKTVHHPIGDISGAQLVAFRFGDLTIHAWDLARAIGADEDLDPELVSATFDSLAPRADFLPATGVFGTGRSGEVPDDADLLHRLLDLTGRRP